MHFRWTFKIEDLGFGFVKEYKTEDKKDRIEDWRENGSYLEIFWNEHCSRWGRFHDYYDGPLDCFCLGRLQLHWSLYWCKKCCAE